MKMEMFISCFTNSNQDRTAEHLVRYQTYASANLPYTRYINRNVTVGVRVL